MHVTPSHRPRLIVKFDAGKEKTPIDHMNNFFGAITGDTK